MISHTIKYSHKKLVNFDIRGMPIYEEVIQSYTIYACSSDELKKRIKQYECYLQSCNKYVYHRHPKSFVWVAMT